MLFCTNPVQSQVKHTEISIDFRVNSIAIDSTYSNNTSHLKEIVDFIRTIKQDTTINLLEVSFCGAASPEGSYQLNQRLAKGRLYALEKFIRNKVEIPDSIITHNDSYIPWDYLKTQIETSVFSHKSEILSIIEEGDSLVDYHLHGHHIDNRIIKLKSLDNGRVWNNLNKLYFKNMRNAYAVFVTYIKEITPLEEKPKILTDTIVEKTEEVKVVKEVKIDTIPIVTHQEVVSESWNRKFYLKTNMLGLSAAMVNVGAEIDLAKHWTLSIPVYYSALNYLISTIKFRTIAIQPEIRYWLSGENNGIFTGTHFGMAYYNIAINGDYRYQSKNGDTPAVGGGINVGYKKPISNNKKLNLEFSIGAGVYSIKYDKYYNVTNGNFIESKNKTYIGIDQVAVTLSYQFDLKKKGGKR